jgi:uncharacterized protein
MSGASFGQIGMVPLLGLVIGVVFGWTVHATNFCVMGALSDVYNLGDRRRLRAWVLAAAMAMVGVQVLRAVGAVPLERAMYLGPQLNWFGHALGGMLFGFGMVLTGGCPTRNLVRAASGDLRALVVLLVVAVTGYMTIGGLIAPARDSLEQLTALDLRGLGIGSQSFGALLAAMGPRGGIASAGLFDLVLAVVGGGAAAVYVLRDRAFRISKHHVASGFIVGVLVVCGWAVTGMAYDEFAAAPLAPVSLTFIRPLGDTLDWLQRFTAIPVPGFGTASVLGTLGGAFLSAWHKGRLRVLGFADVGDVKNNLMGAALMGVGGAMALGCTIGQGITGLSTLSAGSAITTAALIFGGWNGLRYLERTA